MTLHKIQDDIVSCQKCPRLIAWCSKIAQEKRKSFLSETYWGKPVPSFGDPNAQVIFLGLAPAAHGANRTGRMFTGDNSGLWLYRALFEHGFSNQPESKTSTDSLKLSNAYITAVVHCAPPDNKPEMEEIQTCMNHLRKELETLENARIIVALGSLAWNAFFQIAKENGWIDKKPKFSHGALEKAGPYQIVGSYHPSQQNTFTKRLTKQMFDDIFLKIKKLLSGDTHRFQDN
jgi:uracil-DNA glycosylase family 4